MDFRTTIKTTENQGIMHHSDAMMLIGSCFSDNIGAKLAGAMMNVDVNPFGTIYNPMSIADAVDRIITCRPIEGRSCLRPMACGTATTSTHGTHCPTKT